MLAAGSVEGEGTPQKSTLAAVLLCAVTAGKRREGSPLFFLSV
jgi:hypothetical protein